MSERRQTSKLDNLTDNGCNIMLPDNGCNIMLLADAYDFEF